MPSTTPLPAASLILLRDNAGRLEVVLGRRKAAARAFPGAVVFPGGKIEPGDRDGEVRVGLPSGLAPAAPGAAFAALRETFEETGLWLGIDDDARFPEAPGLERLTPYAHWITPAYRPHRFDTWFFIAAARPAEAGASLGGDEFETVAWTAPSEALATAADTLLPPTRHSLEMLAKCASAAAAMTDARQTGPFEAGDLEAGWTP